MKTTITEVENGWIVDYIGIHERGYTTTKQKVFSRPPQKRQDNEKYGEYRAKQIEAMEKVLDFVRGTFLIF